MKKAANRRNFGGPFFKTGAAFVSRLCNRIPTCLSVTVQQGAAAWIQSFVYLFTNGRISCLLLVLTVMNKAPINIYLLFLY